MSRVVDRLKGIWKKIKYEIGYPETSENIVVQDYLAKIKNIVTKKNFFSPSQEEVISLMELCDIIRQDETLNQKETDALLQEIAWPSWFQVEKVFRDF